MAVTVTAKNYSLLNACNATTNWGGGNAITTDSDLHVYGTACLAYTCRTTTTHTLQYTASLDFSGTGVHLRVWFYTYAKPDTLANGGIQLFIGDAVNTAFWKVSGSDVYPGGWVLLSADVSGTPDSGTLPTNRAACTKCGISFKTIASTKNAPSTYVDHLHKADGLIAYGDDAGGYFGLQHIYDADNTLSTARGFIKKINGAYFLNGSLTIGDSVGTSSTKFNIKSQVVVFEDRKVASNLYKIDVADNGTGTTEFILGSKTGPSGIEGCVIRNESATQTAKFYVDGATDTDVDNFKLYGSSFIGASSLSFPNTGANVEILNCNFETCGPVTPKTAAVTSSNIISPTSDGLILSSTSHNVSDCNFIDTIYGINFTTAGEYDLENCRFYGNNGSTLYDIRNSSTGAVIINSLGITDITYYTNTNGGSITINNSVTLTVRGVYTGTEPTNYVRIRIEDASTGAEILNDLANIEDDINIGQWMATSSYNYTGARLVRIRARYKGFLPFTTTGTITTTGLDVNAVWLPDPNFN